MEDGETSKLMYFFSGVGGTTIIIHTFSVSGLVLSTDIRALI